MFFLISRKLASLAIVFAALASNLNAQEKTERAYVFGPSQIHNNEAGETNLAHWLSLMSKVAGHEFAFSGQSGDLRNFAQTLPPLPEWQSTNVDVAWDGKSSEFQDAALTNIWIAPEPSIQTQSPDTPFADEGAVQLSPIEAASQLSIWATQRNPNIGVYLFETWPELTTGSGDFPPSESDLAAYHQNAMADHANWFDTFTDAVASAVPNSDVSLIPTSRVLSSVMVETALSGLSADTFYTENSSVGTPALSLMAAMVAYNTIYGEPVPEDFRPPSTIAPELRATFPMVRDAIWQRTKAFNEASEAAPEEMVRANEDPVTPRPEITFQKPVTQPSVSITLDGISDSSFDQPFLDLMKTARPWVGHKNNQWGAFDAQALESGGYLDDQGWPLRLPEGASALETFILTDQPETSSALAGRYIVRYDGSGKITASGRAKNVRESDGELIFDYTPGAGLVSLSITQTNPDDHIRNIKIYHAADQALVNAGVVFNPAWIAQIENFRVLRLTDWMQTNQSNATTWESRPSSEDYTFARRGVPAETMIDLANKVGADPWFNMPHMADDAYLNAFAELAHTTLRKDLRAYVEYSNEVWREETPQAIYAEEQAKKRWGGKVGSDAWTEFYGMRAAQVAQIWTGVFGSDASDRLGNVFAAQTSAPDLAELSLNVTLWADEDPDNNWPPYVYFTDYAISGQFGATSLDAAQTAEILGWIEASAKNAENAADAEGLTDGDRAAYIETHRYDDANKLMQKSLREGAFESLVSQSFPKHGQVASDHGLRLAMYDGGFARPSVKDDATNTDLQGFLAQFGQAQEARELTTQTFEGWKAAEGTVFFAGSDAVRADPKEDVLLDFNATTPAWWEERQNGAFEGGKMVTGDIGANEIAGTRHADVLIGQDGDDVFTPQGGKDKILGGDGFDAVLLPGDPSLYLFATQENGLNVQGNFVDADLRDIEMLWFEADEDLAIMVEDLR